MYYGMRSRNLKGQKGQSCNIHIRTLCPEVDILACWKESEGMLRLYWLLMVSMSFCVRAEVEIIPLAAKGEILRADVFVWGASKVGGKRGNATDCWKRPMRRAWNWMISCGSIFACYEFYKCEQRKGRAESFFITFVIFCFKLFCGGDDLRGQCDGEGGGRTGKR